MLLTVLVLRDLKALKGERYGITEAEPNKACSVVRLTYWVAYAGKNI